MMFLRASGLTRFAESQQTWRSGALCVASTNVYSLSSGKGKGEWHKG